MAKLKSYSCSKCAGILNYDEGQELFGCPFCGNEFNIADIHRDELLAQGEAALKRRKYDTAKENYKALLDKNPCDFEAQMGMMLAAGRIYSVEALADIDFVKDCEIGAAKREIKKALNVSDKESDYFNKLLVLFDLAKEYKDAVLEKRTRTVEAREKYQEVADMEVRYEEIKEEQTDAIIRLLKELYPFILWFIVFIVIAFTFETGTSIIIPLLVMVFLLVPILFFGIRYFVFEHKKKAFADPNLRDMRFDHRQAESMTEKELKFRNSYAGIYDQLKDLDPTVNGYTPTSASKVDLGPDPFVDVTKTINCAKCGGQLFLDKEKRLYECKFCGVAYGTSLFFSDPLAKADHALRTSDFTEADQRFMHMLMVDPHDHEALLGRILAAGKWKNIHDIDLEDKMLPFMETHLAERTDEAVLHSSEEHKKFFDDMKRIVEVYIQWTHAEQNLKSAKNGIDYVNNNSGIDIGYTQPVYKNITTREEDVSVSKKDELKLQIDTCMMEKKKLREEFTPLKKELEKDKLRLSAKE